MKSFSEIRVEVGYDPNATCPIDAQVVWYAYKNGEAKQFATQQLAMQYSKNIEKGELNVDVIDAWESSQRELKQKAINAWCDTLMDEYKNEVPVKVFNICYNRAYNHGHSYGYDTVAEYLDEEVDFAKQIISIVNNKE